MSSILSSGRAWASRVHCTLCVALGLVGCLGEKPEGLASAGAAQTTVKMDFLHRPLPEIPLPNDIATRHDPTSATRRRINASLVAPTRLERRVRALIDELDGWGVFAPITIPFTGPLDIGSIRAGHDDANYATPNDVIYLVDVDPKSPEFGQIKHLDVGNGNYPVVLERPEYWEHDPRGWTLSIFFDEEDEDRNGNGRLDPGEDLNGNGVLDPGEDLNGNGVLDPPEDTDADGVLDVPNYLPRHTPARDDLPGRADALMTFYERETHTLIVRPLVPLRERTTYAVVVTRRILDVEGRPVGSPFSSINHTAQNDALAPLSRILRERAAEFGGLKLSEVAFAFSFTTQSFQSHWVAVRDGLYGHGVQAHLGADFPPEVDALLPLKDLENRRFADHTNPFVMRTEDWLDALRIVAQQFQGQDPNSEQFNKLLESHQFLDYHVIGRFSAPQLFEREDEEGEWLPLNDQSWPTDLDRIPARARAEDILFWLAVPRRLPDDPAHLPVVVLGHGYGSNRFELLQFAGFFARKGMATVAIDCPSHGIGINPDERVLAERVLTGFGLGPLVEAVFTDRAYDQNGDGRIDSGADFWTAYLFHTRDVVRQCGLDYMTLIRLIRSWDGERRGTIDVNGDGTPELAGDFTGDGRVDVGRDSRIVMTGGSLGGIMANIVGSLEPELDAIAPISGGGGLGDIGNRSQQGGVREAVILRMMGPLFLGITDESGALPIITVVPDLNRTARRPVDTLEGARPWDTFLVENLSNGERGCAYIQADGSVRAAAAADRGDRIRLTLFAGPQLVTGTKDCEIRGEAVARGTIEAFGEDIEFQAETIPAGTPLVALAEGFGERRASPAIRRFLGLAQLVLDGGDPATYARNLLLEPLRYPGTGQETGTHTLVITTAGDMNVPANAGVAVSRAAGLVDYLTDDPRYGMSANQKLIETYMVEAVHNINRFTNAAGEGVHMDVENFSEGRDLWRDDVPRLDPPLRLGFDVTDPLGGRSGSIYPFPRPDGQHGFMFPGEMTDHHRRACLAACADPEDCDCTGDLGFDIGNFMFNLIGDYLVSGGQSLRADQCFSRDDCDDRRPVPPPR